jgi:hypothetical protein
MNEGSGREQVRCSLLVDWPVYPRLRRNARVRVGAQFGQTERPSNMPMRLRSGRLANFAPDKLAWPA